MQEPNSIKVSMDRLLFGCLLLPTYLQESCKIY